MKVYMIWYGGSSYGVPTADEREELPSIAAAVDLFDRRLHNWGVYPYAPCVDEESVGWLFFSDPAEIIGDVYPDRIISIGPRGGIRVERC